MTPLRQTFSQAHEHVSFEFPLHTPTGTHTKRPLVSRESKGGCLHEDLYEGTGDDDEIRDVPGQVLCICEEAAASVKASSNRACRWVHLKPC